MNNLRILLADDHEVVRRGLQSLLETQPHWEVVAEANDGISAVQMTRELAPDVAILDVTMPELNGVEATRQITRECPATRVIILTMHESEQLAREAVRAGARGCVFKSDAGNQLLEAIRAVMAQKTYVSPRVANVITEDGAERGESRETTLSPRERQVLQLLAEGHSNKEVAARLKISARTAETHRTNIMRKLNLHSVSDLTRYAIRNLMVQP